MSMSEQEALEDAYYSELISKISSEAIDDFTKERLQSYYLEHRNISDQPNESLKHAKLLIEDYPTASLIFSVISVETGINNLILKPIISGLVHNESFSELISDILLNRASSPTRYKELFYNLVMEYGEIDLKTYKRNLSNISLWEEILFIQEQRNYILHAARFVSKEIALIGLSVASEIIANIYPRILDKLGVSKIIEDRDRYEHLMAFVKR